jgi:hypothetical protein
LESSAYKTGLEREEGRRERERQRERERETLLFPLLLTVVNFK